MEINKIKTYIGKIVYCVSDTNQIYIFKFENIINDKIHTNDFIVYDSLISDYVYIDKYDNNPLISLNEIKIFAEAYQEQIDMYIERKNYTMKQDWLSLLNIWMIIKILRFQLQFIQEK